jgi:hypothetical protein
MPKSVTQGQQDLIYDLHCFGNHVVFATGDRVFTFDHTASSNQLHSIGGLPVKMEIELLAVNSHSIFATSQDKYLMKIVKGDDGIFTMVKSNKLGRKANSMCCNDDFLFVLESSNDLIKFDCNLEEAGRTSLGYDATRVAYAASVGKLFVGDKSGVIHVLSDKDFAESEALKQH